ncbi:hypothetical protein [Natrinema amylolyticum]|uniref:hypothetical protein n=1 Tax=Natrinema amylolyticum TaxID=2878679 RepID=UPI001CFA035B|nr:hypothetical protein [Natrinema amylolyticum]
MEIAIEIGVEFVLDVATSGVRWRSTMSRQLVQEWIVQDRCACDDCSVDNFVRIRALAVCVAPAIALLVALHVIGVPAPLFVAAPFIVVLGTVEWIGPAIEEAVPSECQAEERDQEAPMSGEEFIAFLTAIVFLIAVQQGSSQIFLASAIAFVTFMIEASGLLEEETSGVDA